MDTPSDEEAANKNEEVLPISPSSTSIDVSLLRGLEPVMSTEEQAQLTAMLVSGDPNLLAQAAKIFNELGVMLKNGVIHCRCTEAHEDRMSDVFRSSFRASPSRSCSRQAYTDYEARVLEEKKQADKERRERAAALPLPVRMPRLVVLNAFDPDGTPVPRSKLVGGGIARQQPSLTFVDYEWDGSLGAAFTRLTVKNDRGARLKKLAAAPLRRDSSGEMVHVEHELKPSPGFDEIALRGGGYDARLVEEAEPVVLIANTRNDAAKLAVHRGDVVTHVNGEEFVGTAAELNMLIKAHYANNSDEATGRQLEIVVNAELCVARALKLRAAH